MGYELDVIQVGGAMLLLIGVGYVLSRFRLLSADEFKFLGTFNTNFAFPFMLFRALASRNFRDLTLLPLFNSLLMSASSQFIIAVVSAILPLKDRLYMYLSTVISSVYINYMIIGLPIFNAIWGTEYDHVPAVFVITHYVLLVPAFILLAQLWKIRKAKAEDPNSEGPDRITLKDVGMAFYTALKTPLISGIIVGAIWAAIGIPYPTFPNYLSRYMGDIVLTFAMVGIGRFMQVNSMLKCNWIQLILCLLIRLFICPGLAVLYAWLLKYDATLARQCTIMSCLPAANAGFVLANSTGIGADIASAMVFWTVILIVLVSALGRPASNLSGMLVDTLQTSPEWIGFEGNLPPTVSKSDHMVKWVISQLGSLFNQYRSLRLF
jgi:predicted permease